MSCTGEITFSMFEESLRDQQLQAYLDGLGLSADDVWALFSLLDHDESHAIDMDEFVTGCLKLRGSARAIDSHLLMYESKWTMRRVSDILRSLRGIGEQLRSLHGLRQEVQLDLRREPAEPEASAEGV